MLALKVFKHADDLVGGGVVDVVVLVASVLGRVMDNDQVRRAGGGVHKVGSEDVYRGLFGGVGDVKEVYYARCVID